MILFQTSIMRFHEVLWSCGVSGSVPKAAILSIVHLLEGIVVGGDDDDSTCPGVQMDQRPAKERGGGAVLESLPFDVCKQHIFPFLLQDMLWTVLPQTCHFWRSTVMTLICQKTEFDLYGFDPRRVVCALTLIRHSKMDCPISRSIQRLVLFDCLTDPFVLRALAGLDTLVELEVEEARLNSNSIATLRELTKLEKLSLPYSKPHSGKDNDLLSQLAGPNVQHLKSIDLSLSELDVDAGFESICRHCLVLESINLSYCDRLTDKSIDAITTYRSETLTELDISRCHQLRNDAVCQLLRRCVNLSVLKLRESNALSSSVLSSISGAIQHLDIGNCKELFDSRSIGDFIHEKKQSLTELNLWGFEKLSDEVFERIGSSSNLKALRLGYCFHLSTAQLMQIAHGCPKLQEISISSCCNIGDAGLIALSRSCPDLQRLYAYKCTRITDAGLRAIATNCRRLQHISVNGCSLLTKRGLLHLATQSTELVYVALGARADIDPELLSRFNPKCRIMAE